MGNTHKRMHFKSDQHSNQISRSGKCDMFFLFAKSRFHVMMLFEPTVYLEKRTGKERLNRYIMKYLYQFL